MQSVKILTGQIKKKKSYCLVLNHPFELTTKTATNASCSQIQFIEKKLHYI